MKTKPISREIQAKDIMTKPVESVYLRDSLQQVAHLFTDNHISAAAVMDEKGNPIGVITKTDLVRHEEETYGIKTTSEKDLPGGFHTIGDEEKVQDWMTPVIFSAKPTMPVKEVARRMVRFGTHHIFVRDARTGPILGVVSSFDVLRHVASKNGKTVDSY